MERSLGTNWLNMISFLFFSRQTLEKGWGSECDGGRETYIRVCEGTGSKVLNKQAQTFIQKATITSGSCFRTPNFPFSINSSTDSRRACVRVWGRVCVWHSCDELIDPVYVFVCRPEWSSATEQKASRRKRHSCCISVTVTHWPSALFYFTTMSHIKNSTTDLMQISIMKVYLTLDILEHDENLIYFAWNWKWAEHVILKFSQ